MPFSPGSYSPGLSNYFANYGMANYYIGGSPLSTSWGSCATPAALGFSPGP
jgi:hypothetical protein